MAIYHRNKVPIHHELPKLHTKWGETKIISCKACSTTLKSGKDCSRDIEARF